MRSAGPTPLENYARLRNLRRVPPTASQSDAATDATTVSSEQLGAPSMPATPSQTPSNARLQSKLFSDALDFAHLALFGRTAPPHVRQLWTSMHWSSDNHAEVFQRVLDHRKVNDAAIWSRLGVIEYVTLEPAAWLELDAMIFVVGVHHRLTNELPSVHCVIELLLSIVRENLSPVELVNGMAKSIPGSEEAAKKLSAACIQTAGLRWPWQRMAKPPAIFDRGRTQQSVWILQLAHNMGQTSYGAVNFEMLHRVADYLSRSLR